MIQQDLFGDSSISQQNPLTERRVGFIGKFKNRSALVKKVNELGASDKSKDGITRDTQILVMGSEVKLEDLNRLLCYEHDGWKPLKITEADLLEIFKGHYAGFETPAIAKKQVSLDMSYYNWTPPILQIIGNFGGYANAEYFDDTNIIMLSGETLRLLEQGLKDDVIKQIEAQYNQSSTKMFNIQFTSEPDFILWVKKRMEKFPDESTMELLRKYDNYQSA